MRILIVEDAEKLGRFLVRALEEEGYAADHVMSGGEGLEAAGRHEYDAVILDWMLPDIDGLAVCRELRRRGATTPVLMLTARSETGERVMGLEAGADDYLVKPFEVEELIARLRALVRRTTGFTMLKCGDMEVDRVERQVRISGQPIELTGREFSLLLHLVYRADQVVGRSELLEHVWESRTDPGSNVVEVQVSRLREKLGNHSWMLETVRGAGYRLRTRSTTEA